MKRISVLLAEDHNVVREGIRSLLELERDIEVAGEARDGRQAVLAARKLRPAVVVMDVAMPDMNGFEAARQILRALPATRILALSAYDDDAYVDELIGIGVSGYLLKHSSAKVLVAAIRAAVAGNTYFSPRIAKRLRARTTEAIDRNGVPRRRKTVLTRRETETLQLVAEGQPNKLIADALRISVKTVEKHRHNLMAKLDIHSTAGLTRYAIGAGVAERAARGIGEESARPGTRDDDE